MHSAEGTREPPRGRVLAGLGLGALGVVYGDIGTSPLYALRECFAGPHSVPATHENILGVLSLVFWAINFVVSFKYIGFVMRADNRGEGGILALLALVRPRGGGHGPPTGVLVGLGLFGAALLYGDGIITPAVSVLGAVEGVSVATPALEHTIPSCASCDPQPPSSGCSDGARRASAASSGRSWSSGSQRSRHSGSAGSSCNPSVLRAVNPYYAVVFFADDGLTRVSDPGLGGPGDHRRRGALRRHGALRKAADPARVV